MKITFDLRVLDDSRARFFARMTVAGDALPAGLDFRQRRAGAQFELFLDDWEAAGRPTSLELDVEPDRG